MKTQDGIKVTGVKDVLLRMVKEGEYNPGERLPSVRDLARKFGVSPVTATLALRELSKMGIVEARRGAGTFVLRMPEHSGKARVVGLACGHWLASKGHFHQTAQSPSLSCYYDGIALYSGGGRDISVQLLRYHQHRMMEKGGEVRRALESGALDGLLVLSSCDPEEINFIQRQGVPVVMCGGRARMWNVPWVAVNYVSGFRQIVSLLMSLGHGRIRLLMNALAGMTKSDLCGEYVAIAKAVGLADFDLDAIVLNDPQNDDRAAREAEYIRAAEELMGMKPTAVVVVDEVAADFVIRHCARAKIRIPDDVSIVALNDMTPALHGMRLASLNIQEAIVDMTYEALTQLENVIERHDTTLGTTITPSIVAGDSLAPAKAGQGVRRRESVQPGNIKSQGRN